MITLSIYRDVDQSNHIINMSITPEMRYRRTAKGLFGDDQASFTMQGGAAYLRDVFSNWLGCWMFERENGASALTGFMGQIHTMRLYVMGRIYAVSLGDIFNQVVVGYATSWGGAVSYATATNTASQSQYGTRFLRVDLEAPTTGTSAATTASDIADDLGSVRPYLVGFYPRGDGNKLEITAMGTAHVLEAEYHHQITSADILVNNEIRYALNNSDIVELGDEGGYITAKINSQVYYTSIWRRLEQCFSGLARNFRGGCWGSRMFDYYQLDRDNPRYYLSVNQHGERVFYENNGGSIVPDSMVRAGNYVRLADLGLGGLPDTILLDSLTFSPDGLQFSAALEDRLAMMEAELG